MNLDEALKLARQVEAYGRCCENDGCVYNQGAHLSAAVLAMAPVVAATMEWRRLFDDTFFADHGERMYQVDHNLRATVDALSTLSSKVPHGE